VNFDLILAFFSIRNSDQDQIHKMPHEIFMTAIVPDGDATKARSVLTGVTETRERHRYTKIRYMQREDASPKTLDKFKELGKESRNPHAARWQELHQILLAQSYIVQERVDITPEVLSRKSGYVLSAVFLRHRLLTMDCKQGPHSRRHVAPNQATNPPMG
jgi:hypothetical protein